MKQVGIHLRTSSGISILLGVFLLFISVPVAMAQDGLQSDGGADSFLRNYDSVYPSATEAASQPSQSIDESGVRTFPVLADAEIQQAWPDTNFGIQPRFSAGYDNWSDEPTGVTRSLLNFEVAHFLRPNSTIQQATLRLKLAGYCDSGTSTYQVHRVADAWTEMGVTWSNQPASAEGYGSQSIPLDGSFGWYTFDVTALVQGWIDGTYTEHGLMLVGPERTNGCAQRAFRSRGGGGFYLSPELVVDYTDSPTALTVSKTDFSFEHECNVGADLPDAQPLILQSNTTDLIDWSATLSSGSSWLTLDKVAGRTSRIFSDEIMVGVNDSAPCPGEVTEQIQIAAPDAATGAQTIDVTLKRTAPTLNISADELPFSRTCGSPLPPSQTITLETAALTATDWTATVVGGDGWLSLDKQSGQVSSTSPDQIVVSVGEPLSCEGVLDAEIQINAPNLVGSSHTVRVRFAQSHPSLVASTTRLAFSHQCEAAAPEAQRVEISSDATTPLEWVATVTGGDNWLQLSKDRGQVSSQSPDHIEISVLETPSCPQQITAEVAISVSIVTVPQQQIEIVLAEELRLFLPNAHRAAEAQTINAAATTFDRVALLIGVADYLYLDPPPGFSILRTGRWGFDLGDTTSDWSSVHAPIEGGITAYDPDAIESGASALLSLAEEQATHENVTYAFDWIAERTDAETEVIVYISSHGGRLNAQGLYSDTPPLNEFLGLYDTNSTPQFTNHLLDDDFEAQLAELETEHLAVIIDACNSGGMQVSNPYRAVLAASQADQNSWETSEFEHGVFTFYMLQALLDPASDTNDDGWVSIQEIYDYARDLVAQYVGENTDEEQHLSLDLTRDFKVAPVSRGGTGR